MKNKEKIRKNWTYVAYLAVLFMIAIIMQDVVKESIVFDYNIDLFQNELNIRLQEEVYKEVDFRVKEIESNIERVNDDLEEHILEDLDPLKFAITSQNELISSETQDNKRIAILNTVKAYDALEENHCYYVMDSTGIELYSCESKTFVNLDRYNELDYFSRPYMKELIDETVLIGNTKSEFYIERDNHVFKNVSFTYLDTITNYIIGIRVEYENYSEITKEELIYQYNNYYDETETEFFIIDGDSTVLYHKNKEIVGLTVGELEGSNSYLSISQLYSSIADKPEGYVKYTDIDDGKTVERIAYIKYIEEWDIIIASSLETGLYDYLIENYRVENYNNTVIIKVPIYLILVIVGYVIYRLIRTNINLSLSISDEEELLYKRFANITTDSIVITDDTGIIQFINKYGIDTLFDSFNEEEKLNFNNLLVEEDGYYSIYTEVKTYHIKYNVEQIIYNGKHCDLYIIKDLTDKIVTEKALKAMTLADDLTKLGNRRLLVSDFQEKLMPFIKAGNVSQLVMIDLDNFKDANDKYGHRFGDEVLLTIANIFKVGLEDSCNIYRLGGDEFAVLTKGQSPETLIEQLKEVNQTIIDFDFGKEVDLSFSAGIVDIKLSDVKRRLSDYYQQADEKLYKAKEKGKSIIVY